jgi:hypothetical protein
VHDDGRAGVGGIAERRRVDGDARDPDVVAAPPDRDPVDPRQLRGRQVARRRREVGEDDDASASATRRLAEGDLHRRTHGGRRVERCDPGKLLGEASAVGGPAERDARSVRRRHEQHGRLGGQRRLARRGVASLSKRAGRPRPALPRSARRRGRRAPHGGNLPR